MTTQHSFDLIRRFARGSMCRRSVHLVGLSAARVQFPALRLDTRHNWLKICLAFTGPLTASPTLGQTLDGSQAEIVTVLSDLSWWGWASVVFVGWVLWFIFSPTQRVRRAA